MQISKEQIKKLHTLKGQISHLADRSTYEEFLSSCVERPIASSTEMSVEEAGRVIDELLALLDGRPTTLRTRATGRSPLPRGHFPGRPTNMEDPDRGKLLKKIEALLADGKRPWAYADSMAQRMFRVDRIAWCNADQLHRIVGALVIDQRRRGRGDRPVARGG